MIREKLKELEQQMKKYNAPELIGASENDFEALIVWFRDKFESTYITETRELYKLANGFEFNGTIVYSISNSKSNNILDENETWADINIENKFLFLGDADISWYCLNVFNGKYHVLDKPSGDTVEVYDSFEKLMNYVIDIALI